MPAEEAETARARLLALVPAGFEEVEGEGWVELAAYVEEAGLAALRAAFPGLRTEPVEDGWEDRWRAFHRPVQAGGLWIGPPWAAPPPGECALIVDPGRAFGTGAHPTTRACLELLAGSERGSLLDAGCGSGVLAAAGARLGFAPVLALDVDGAAVQAAAETASRNRVAVEVRQADVLRDPLPEADLVVANIELPAVEALLARRPARRAIVSGYLARDAVRAPGWRRLRRLELEGWAAEALEAL
ncbi:MAG TPA: 50S ribosomal protein L11 methyltransferase [Gaiellaceae bacterium]|nr:50S ribosomal protein L11 methyltransferase [Gaiellaceae bacterium]